MQAAQAGYTFSLKRQLLDAQAQARAAVVQNTSMEAELRELLQSATVKTEAAQVEVEELAARLWLRRSFMMKT